MFIWMFSFIYFQFDVSLTKAQRIQEREKPVTKALIQCNSICGVPWSVYISIYMYKLGYEFTYILCVRVAVTNVSSQQKETNKVTF